MSWKTTLVLAVFIAVCGLIAYLGDLIGRKMGKKRLSLFGMRPRYTAIVTTTFTGMLIAAITISVLLTASANVKLLFLEGEKILAENKQLEAERDSLQARTSQLNDEIKELEKTLAKSTEITAEAERKLKIAADDLDKARKEISNRRAEINRLEKTIKTLTERRGDLEKGVKDSLITDKLFRENLLVFGPGEEIARVVIDCSQTRPQIRKQVTGLLDKAEEIARRRGAGEGEDGKTIEILKKRFEGKFLADEATISAIIDEISSGSGSVVLRIYSVGNSVAGEPALVEFHRLRENVKVYDKGEAVAISDVVRSTAPSDIMNFMMVFLKSEVRPNAINEGLIPTLDKDGQESVGQIDWDKLFDLIYRIRSSSKHVRIKAAADRELWSSDSLSLDFQLVETE